MLTCPPCCMSSALRQLTAPTDGADCADAFSAAGKVTDPAARAELEQVIKDWDTLKEKLGVTGDT